MKFMLGTKGRMTQVFDDAGVVRAVTIITAGPLTVTQVKGKETDGYEAAQVGFGTAKAKNKTKPVLGQGKGVAYKALREMRTEGATFEIGQTIDVTVFAVGDVVAVWGVLCGGVRRVVVSVVLFVDECCELAVRTSVPGTQRSTRRLRKPQRQPHEIVTVVR